MTGNVTFASDMPRRIAWARRELHVSMFSIHSSGTIGLGPDDGDVMSSRVLNAACKSSINDFTADALSDEDGILAGIEELKIKTYTRYQN